MLGDECLQPQTFIQLAHQNEASVRSDARSLERDFQEAVERELEWLVLSFTHRVSPSVVWFLTSEPQNSRRSDWSWRYGTTAKSEIRAESIEEIFPERARSHHLPEVAVGRRNDPHIDRAHVATAETTNLAVLNRA